MLNVIKYFVAKLLAMSSINLLVPGSKPVDD